MKKALYLIGGGPLGLRIFQWAAEMNIAVLLTDINAGAPGRELAAMFSNISADADIAEHKKFAKRAAADYQICGVYCGNEIGTPNANRLKEHLGMDHVSEDVIATVADKTPMNDCFEAEGIRTPESWNLASLEELAAALPEVEGPIIFKPSLGSGSRGVQWLSSEQLGQGGSTAEEIWETSMAPVDYRGVTVQEAPIEGRSIDANGFFYRGTFYRAGVLEKFISAPPTCLPLGGNDPADLTGDQVDEVYDLLDKACRALGLVEGPVKGDFILSDDDGLLYVLEVAPRFHGDVTTCNTLPFGTGINPLKFMLGCWANESADESLIKPTGDNKAIWRVLCLPPGLDYTEIFTDEFELPEGITCIWFNPRHNGSLSAYGNTTEIPGYICGYGSKLADAEDVLEKACDALKSRIAEFPDRNAWYGELGKTLEEIKIRPASSGYVSAEEKQ